MKDKTMRILTPIISQLAMLDRFRLISFSSLFGLTMTDEIGLNIPRCACAQGKQRCVKVTSRRRSADAHRIERIQRIIPRRPNDYKGSRDELTIARSRSIDSDRCATTGEGEIRSVGDLLR